MQWTVGGRRWLEWQRGLGAKQTLPSSPKPSHLLRVRPVAEAVVRGLGMEVNKGKGQRSQTAINLTAQTQILCAVRRRTVAPLSWCWHCQHGQALQNKCIGQQNARFINSTNRKKCALLVANLILVFVFTFPCITCFAHQPCEDRARCWLWVNLVFVPD